MSIVEQIINHPLLETIEKIAKISGIFYLIGMISLSLSYYFNYGFHDFDIPYQQVIYAGIWMLVYVTLACAPTLIGTKIVTKYGSKLSRRSWINILLLLLLSLFTLVYKYRISIGHFISTHYLGYLLGNLAIMSIGIGAFLSTLVPEWAKQLYSKESDTWTAVITSSLMLLCAFAILFLFTAFHSTIPMALGGGKPEQRDIWVAKDEFDIYNDCKGPTPITYKTVGDATLIPNVSVLHETKDNFIIWRPKCPTIALPRSSVKTYQWAQPNSK
jgi:hypothetical protein